MDLNDLLEPVRQSTIDRLALAIHEAKTAGGESFVSEPVLREGDRTPVPHGRLAQPARHDLPTGNIPGEIALPAFAPVGIEWPGGLAVVLRPFRWDALRVHFPEGNPSGDWEPLLGWFEEWFKAEEDGVGDLLLVVHSVSDPVDEGDGQTLTIDLGSAPVVAIEDLFDALAGLDVSRVEIGVPDLLLRDEG